MKKITTILISVLSIMLVAFTGCTSGSSNEPYPSYIGAFGTLESVTSSAFVFSVQTSADSDPIMLNFTTTGSTDALKVGARYYVMFTTYDNDDLKSGPAELVYSPFRCLPVDESYVTISEAPLEEIKSVTKDVLNVGGVNRTGSYLNFMAAGELYDKPEVFALKIDETTADSEWPDVYICYRSDNSVIGQAYTFYASFDISPLLKNRNLKGIKLHCYSNNNPVAVDMPIEVKAIEPGAGIIE